MKEYTDHHNLHYRNRMVCVTVTTVLKSRKIRPAVALAVLETQTGGRSQRLS